MVNTTCDQSLVHVGDEEVANETPLWKSFTFHHFGLFLSVAFGAVAVIIAGWLIMSHALHYSKPYEQRHIIRILFMIPVYAVVSFLSYLFYKHAIYFEVIRDCYEAFAIASFFTLLYHYLEPTLHEQKNYFRQLNPKNWILPINWLQKCTGGENGGPFRKPQSGLTWFNVVWLCVFQYCFIRVVFTFVSLASQYFNRYCESSLSPVFAHIWVLVFESTSVTIAMYGLIQFYIQLKDDIAHYKPFLKILCIKLVIFFSFWQTIIISFLSSSDGPLKPSDKIAYPDIKVGIPSVLLCIEMTIFAIMHIFAFSSKPYHINKRTSLSTAFPEPGVPSNPSLKYFGGFLGVKALLDAFNPWDIVKASARGFRWLFVGRKHRKTDSSYQTNPKTSYESSYTNGSLVGNGGGATELHKVQIDHSPEAVMGAGGIAHYDSRDDRPLLHPQANNPGYQSASYPYTSSSHPADTPRSISPVSALTDSHSVYPSARTDISTLSSSTPRPPSGASPYGPGSSIDPYGAEQDTGYHGATRFSEPTSEPEPRPSKQFQRAYEKEWAQQQQQSHHQGEWEHWGGGAQKPR